MCLRVPGLALTNAVTACSRSVFVSATGTWSYPKRSAMSQARTPETMATPDARKEVKSTSHSQLMSRPSAYSSLTAIMVSALAGSKLASERRKPIGFLTSSSSTGEPLMSMTSPRPKAGVTRETAAMSSSADTAQALAAAVALDAAALSCITARTTASAAAALYRL